MKGNSFSNGPGAGASVANGPASPAQVTVCGTRLGGEHWWRLV